MATKHGAVDTTQDSTARSMMESRYGGEYDEVSKSTQDSLLIESTSQGLEPEAIPFHRSLKNNTPTDANMPLGNTLISSPTKVPFVFSVHDTKVKIIIAAGNITRANVDAIVCTESGEFSGRGAIARQIMKMAGELYKSQYKDQQRGKHELTSVTAMEADGQLMCHYVLHAVSPHWTHYYTQHNQDFSRHIRLTVHNILTKASEFKIQSVAIPFLGTSDDEHARSTPVTMCCDVIVEAILQFFAFPRTSNTAENSIMEVHLLSTVQRVVNNWKEEMEKHLKTQAKEHVRTEGVVNDWKEIMEKQLETHHIRHVRNYSPKEDRELNRYVEIENIPVGTTADKLKSLLFIRGFPIAPPQLVFTDGMVKAIAICQGENDAVKLSCFTGNHIFKFKHLKEQSLGIFTQKLDAKLLKVVYKKKQYKRLVDELLAIEVNLADGSIETKTSIQLQCAEAIVASCGERLGVYTHKETHSEFELLAHNETVSGVSVLIWDVVKTVKAKEINKIKSRDGSVEMDSKTSCITINLLSTSGDDMAHATVVKSFAESIKCNDIVEIEVDAKDAADAPKWCKDIQEKLNYTGSFCIYTPDDKKVVVCCESYDDILKITHQFLIKQGKVKTTARGGRRHREVNSEPSTSDNRSSQQQSSDICSGKHSDFDWEREASLIKKYQTAEGIVVCVYKASIVKLPVDCIVNAANATLQHGGGVAKVIADAAGHILTIEGDDYRRRYGNIQVGQVCSTTAGRLPYACVIHTVGPRWYDYTPHTLVEVKRCEEDLYSAIYECFMEAEKKHLTSIALPPVSAAKLGVPEEFCVYHYAKATLDYSKRSSASSRLNEIHFIDINQNIIRNIQDAFEDMLHGKSDYDVQTFVKQQPYRRHNSPSQRYNYNENSDRYGRNKNMQGSQAVGGSNSASNYATNQGDEQNWPPTSGISQFAITPDSQDNEKYIVRFRSSEEPTLVLWKTNILSVQASVVVSVEDTKGTGRGKVAELIAKGLSRITVSQYSSEKKRVFSHNTKIGDVLVTKGYESGYGHIFHVVLAAAVVGSIMIKDRIKILGSTYDKILRLADDNENIKSLVMPLVGTGFETKDDVKASADAFIDSYRVFCNRKWQKSNTRPLTVNLVFREQTNLSLVLSILEKQISDSQLPPVKVPPRPSQPPQHYRPKMTDEVRVPRAPKTVCEKIQDTFEDMLQGKSDYDVQTFVKQQPSRRHNSPSQQYNHNEYIDRYGRNKNMQRSQAVGGSNSASLFFKSIGACAKTNCVVCSNSLSDPIVLDCGHVFCRDCITQQFKLRKICPTCGKVCEIKTGEESRRSMAGSDIVGTVKLEKSTVLDVDAHSSDGVQLMADSDFAGSIKLENTTVSNVDSNSSDGVQLMADSDFAGSIKLENTTVSNVDSNSSDDDDDDDVSLDNFELILKCVAKDGGCSMKILKAEIGFEALKWRYVFQNQDKRTKFEQKIKAFSATLVCKGESPVVIETNKVLKISTLSKNIKQFIQSETSELHVEEAIVDADEIKRVIGIMSFTSSALTNQSVLRFIQCPQGQTKVWFVGVGKDVLEVLNLFKQTQKYLSNIAPSGAT